MYLQKRTPQQKVNRLDDLLMNWNQSIRDMTHGHTLALDVVEYDDHYLIKTDMPGMSEDHIHIDIADGILTLTAEKEDRNVYAREDVIMRERRYGRFSRQIQVPDDVNVDAIEMSYENGVFTMWLPRN